MQAGREVAPQAPEAVRARRIALPSRGGEVAALDVGPATRPVDVVFSHANGFNALTYRSILAPLAGELRILAFDLRGHGASTLRADPDDREGWNDFRDDLLAVLDAERLERVVLAGHSMGGTSSLLAAAAAPERVRSLVLFDPVLFDPPPPGAEREPSPLVEGARRRRATFPSKAAALEAYRGRGAFKTWSEAQLADYVEAGFKPTADGEATLTCAPAWEASNFSTHNYDPWAAFAQTRCPIRLLRAAFGSTSRVDERLADLTADGRLSIETIPGTSHFLPMERPELVRAELLRDVRP